MKKILMILMLVLTFHFSYSQQFSVDNKSSENQDFKLHYMNVGFGSNRYRMQPVFVVNNQNFIYTMETVWVSPDQTNIPRDTLLTGKFRISSIDSIKNLIRGITDTSIYKSAMVLSGSATHISIETGQKKLHFTLFNTSDSIAENIVSILSTYIPNEINNLYISKAED